MYVILAYDGDDDENAEDEGGDENEDNVHAAPHRMRLKTSEIVEVFQDYCSMHRIINKILSLLTWVDSLHPKTYQIYQTL